MSVTPNPTVREPAVAGTFYPGRPAELREGVEALLGPPRESGPARLLLAPHAGYMYSGSIAGEVYSRIAPPPLVVVLAPNHWGLGAPLAMPRRGSWRTPLGTLAIDPAAADEVASRDPLLKDDWRAHARDHALEVQLPFLQVRAAQEGRPAPALLTISCGTLDLPALLQLGDALASGLRALGREKIEDVLIVVSSDMSHYIPAAEARSLDLPALRLALALEPEALHDEVTGKGISMCGIAPAVAGLAAARALGARPGELVRYGHSGEVTGDEDSVVAYAALLFRE